MNRQIVFMQEKDFFSINYPGLKWAISKGSGDHRNYPSSRETTWENCEEDSGIWLRNYMNFKLFFSPQPSNITFVCEKNLYV